MNPIENITALIYTILQKESGQKDGYVLPEVIANMNETSVTGTQILALLKDYITSNASFNLTESILNLVMTVTKAPDTLVNSDREPELAMITLSTNIHSSDNGEQSPFGDPMSGDSLLGQSFEADDSDEIVPLVRITFYILYALICIIGLVGNALVFYAVIRTPTMHNVTNVFIANLALADILLCIFAVPITPLYLIAFKEWIFGAVFCHLLPFAQGVSVYISAFTLMSIAIDRYFVIIYPFRPRMQMTTCLWIIVAIWASTCILTAPLANFMKLSSVNTTEPDGNRTIFLCDEGWPSEKTRKTFGFSTSILQFVIPFIIITFCYTRVCMRLSDRAKTIPGSVSVRREEQERERARKTNAMLISMVVIFVVSWLPFNIHNLIVDFFQEIAEKWNHSQVVFHVVHATAMSSTCYNPFLYAWLNENFRKEFKAILPCFSRFGQCKESFKKNNRRNGNLGPSSACHVKVKITENTVQ